MKHRLLWIGIILIILSVIGNTMYFEAQQIEEPIFLDHYYEYSINDSPLMFFYITNKQDSRRVNYITINGKDFYVYQDYHFFHESNEPDYVAEYQHHALRKINIEMNEEQLKELQKPFTFTEITVNFNDGSSIVTDIGKVVLNERKSIDQDIYEHRHSGGSSSGRSIQSLQFNENTKFDSISFPFEEIKDDIKVKLNIGEGNSHEEWQKEINESGRHPIEPELKADWKDLPGETFKDDSTFSIEKGQQLFIYTHVSEDILSMYRFPIYLYGSTDQNKKVSIPVHTDQNPNLSPEQIDELIETKGEKQ